MVKGTANCEQVWREISNYVDGEVDVTLRAAMDAHFGECARCRSVLEGTRNVIQLYGDERMIELPAGFDRRLEKRLEKNARPGAGRWLTWEAWLVPVAAMALIAGGFWMVNSRTTLQQTRSQQANVGENIPPDLAVVVAEGTKIFHVPGCVFIHDKDHLRKLTAKEALKEGFTPCPRCLKKYLEPATAVTIYMLPAVATAYDADDDEDSGRHDAVRADAVRVDIANSSVANSSEVRRKGQ